MKKIFLSLALTAFLGFNAMSQVQVSPFDSNILVEGRTINKENAVSFCYPGTAFSVKFIGTSADVKLKAEAGYYAYSVDNGGFTKFSTHGAYQKDGVCTVNVAKDLPAGEHTVKVMLVNEGYAVFPEFYGFQLNDGAKVLKIDTKKKLKIEFIGNSITCGYGVEAKSRDDHFADSTENFTKSFAGQVIKRLDAVSMVVARSGIGVYKNFGDPKSGSAWPMPRVYDRALYNDTVTVWDFSRWKPDVIVICLGTNDLSEDNYDYEKFALAYMAFLKDVRKHNPGAKIVLCNSPMLHYQQSQDLMNVVANSKNGMLVLGDYKIYRFDFQELTNPEDYGADWHPSAAFASNMGKYLSYYIQTEVLKKK